MPSPPPPTAGAPLREDGASPVHSGSEPVARPAPEPPPAAPRRLSEELAALSTQVASGDVTLRQMITILQGRGYDLLVLLLALPFLLPLPLPGLSTPFGLVIALIAARLTVGRRPWLPHRLLETRLPPGFVPRVLRGARHFVRGLEWLLRPRLTWLTGPPGLRRLHAAVILAASIILLLPLPPGTNFPPALCITIMAAGLLERDGIFVVGAYVALAINLLGFFLVGVYGTRAFHLLWEHFTA